MLVIGDKEQAANAVAVRSRREGDLGVLSIADFSKRMTEEINTRQS